MGIYGQKILNSCSDSIDILNEDKIYHCKGMCITVDSSGLTERNFDKSPYFKVYNSDSVSDASAVARIHIDDAVYEKHHTGLPEWKLNSTDRKKLESLMDKKPNVNSKKLSKFDTVYDAINYIASEKTNGKFKPNKNERPNYRNIKEE